MDYALIIGSTSDIGKAIARKYASAGYGIYLTARDLSKIESLESDIKIRYEVPCKSVYFDALKPDQHASFWQELPQKPVVVVYVAGYMGDQAENVLSTEESFQVMGACYTGAVSILNIVSRDFQANKNGLIIGISSVAGDRGRQSNYIYGSAKAAFSSYLSGLRNELFPSKVHVLTVKPGFVYTRMTEHLTLPPLLTAHPELVAEKVYQAGRKKKNTLYVKWFWKYIMLIIKLIPEGVFKKLKL
jgi:decaprenylphospho-beta-D-erythro-pentofuranosid-2-ulose 2-reductase